jgi:HK97 family phage prohead protease
MKTEIRFAIETAVQEPMASQYGETQGERVIREVSKRLMINDTLKTIVEIRRALPRFSQFDAVVGVLQEKGPELSEVTVRSVASAVEKIRKTLPIGTRIERRSMQFAVHTRTAGEHTADFWATTPTKDAHGTKVIPMGIDLSRYERSPIVLFGHDGYFAPDAANVMGKAVNLRKSEKGLQVTVEFLPASVNPRAEMVYQMVKRGAISAMSIGFQPLEVQTEMEYGEAVPVITKSLLLELSIVPIGSNPDALVTGRAKSA